MGCEDYFFYNNERSTTFADESLCTFHCWVISIQPVSSTPDGVANVGDTGATNLLPLRGTTYPHGICGCKNNVPIHPVSSTPKGVVKYQGNMGVLLIFYPSGVQLTLAAFVGVKNTYLSNPLVQLLTELQVK